MELQYDAENNEFFDASTGDPYNPAVAAFGNQYAVETADGSVYNLNATTGDLTTSIDPNGNTTTYAANSISENGYQLVTV